MKIRLRILNGNVYEEWRRIRMPDKDENKDAS